MRFILAVAVLLLLPYPGQAATGSTSVDITVAHETTGPLHVLGSNPHYFATPDGKGIYLTGEDTWTGQWSFANLGTFAFTPYVDYLATLNQNFLRLWGVWDETLDGPFGGHGAIAPQPFNRSGTCCAGDGGNKWNLTSFNATYFNNLKANVEYAASKGMYVMVLLFFDTDYSVGPAWATNTWNGANNINGTTTDLTQVEGVASGTTFTLQQAYTRKFMDTLATEPNVLWEVANEGAQSGNASPSGWHTWQTAIINLIHSYEASQGYMMHPVGEEGMDEFISSSSADFVLAYGTSAGSPASRYSLGKPVITDTDHYGGGGQTVDWWWQAFMNGNNVIGMDDMHGTGLTGNLDFGFQPGIVNNRNGVQQTRSLTKMVDMTAVVPHPELASTGYALADPARIYIVWANSGGSVTVDLSATGAVTLHSKWLDTVSGAFSSSMSLTGGSGSQSFVSPFNGNPAALLVTK